jgi:acyl-CoA thioesterase
MPTLRRWALVRSLVVAPLRFAFFTSTPLRFAFFIQQLPVGSPDHATASHIQALAFITKTATTLPVAVADHAIACFIQQLSVGSADHTVAFCFLTTTLPVGLTDHAIAFFTQQLPVGSIDHAVASHGQAFAFFTKTDYHVCTGIA